MQNEPSPDMSGLATGQPTQAWVSVPEVVDMFLASGLPRNERTIRRYCKRGDLACQKTENALHQPQYFIDPASVDIYIEQQKSLPSSRVDGSGSDRTDPDDAGSEVTKIDVEEAHQSQRDDGGQRQTGPDSSGPSWAMPPQLVDQLEARIADKDAEIAFLRGELQHRRTTDAALHDVILAFRANAEAQRLAAAPRADAVRPSAPDTSRQAQYDPD